MTVVAVGTCTLRASQAGNAVYLPAANVDQSFVVTPAAQTVSFSLAASRYFDTPAIALHATASSGLPVSYASLTTAVCRMNDNWLSLLTIGNCTIRASQSGGTNYAAAASVDQSFTVLPALQSLLFPPIGQQSLAHPQLQPQATASSGLTVSFASLTPATCAASGMVITLVAAGTCTLRATQAGNANFAAISAEQSFQVVISSIAVPAVVVPGPFIEYSTLLGGYGADGYGLDTAFDVVVAPDGAAYVGGSIASSYFPGISSATFSNGGLDMLFVAKMNQDRGQLDAATVVGARSASVTGSGAQPYAGTDQVEAMAISPAGIVHVAAYASSVTYPLAGGTYVRAGQKSIYRIGADGVVQALPAIVDPAVKTIRALAVDAAGAIYITGAAAAGLATTSGAAISAAAASTGGPYLIKFAPGGTSVAYATYLSIAGSRSSMAPDSQRSLIDNTTTGYALAVDAAGNAFVAGQATANDFPATPGSPDTSDNQNRDAFVAKVNATGSALAWVARLGGQDAERATSIALAPDGSVVIGGNSATIPDRGFGGFQTAFTYDMLLVDREHGFVAKLAADGSKWLFYLPIGSEGGNLVRGAGDSIHPSPIKIAVDRTGAIYASGSTAMDRTLPVAVVPVASTDLRAMWQEVQSPANYDGGIAVATLGSNALFRANGAFLMKLAPEGNLLYYSVIVNQGRATGVAIDAFGAAYVTGYRAGLPQVNSSQAAPGSVFIAKVIGQSSPVLVTTAPNSSTAGETVTFTATLGDARYLGSMEFRDGAQLIATVPVASGTASLSTALALGIHRLTATFVGAGPFNGAASPEVLHVVNQAGAGP